MRATISKYEAQERVVARIAAAQKVLEREVAALHSGNDWRRYLDLQTKLHAYSPNNVMLIASQHAQAYAEGQVPTPEPTYIAGFRTWQALGRSVMKGQHGYSVLAPVRRRERNAIDADGNLRRLAPADRPAPDETEESRHVIRGFTVEHVFDVSQTHGVALPIPPEPKLLAGEAPPRLGQAVLEMIEARGWTVDTVAARGLILGANGLTDYNTKKILVRADMDDAAMVKTLIHEAAHVLLHERPPGLCLPRPTKEVEAESVAYVAAAAHGMPTDDYTFPYVLGWAGECGARAVAETQARVASAARTILQHSPAEHLDGGKVSGAEAAVAAARELRAKDAVRRPEPVVDRRTGPGLGAA